MKSSPLKFSTISDTAYGGYLSEKANTPYTRKPRATVQMPANLKKSHGPPEKTVKSGRPSPVTSNGVGSGVPL